MVRGAETGDQLADGLLAGRAGGEVGSGDRPPQGEVTTAGGTVAVTEFVFVQGHESRVGNQNHREGPGPGFARPSEPPLGVNLTGFEPRAIVETAGGNGMTDLPVRSQSLPRIMTELVLHSTTLPEAAIIAFGNQLGRSPDSLRGQSARWQKVTATPELTALAESHRVDIAFVPESRRRADFSLLVMDMDSTLITIECIDEIADRIGVKPQVSAITEAAMRGELDFAGALRRRVALLEGLEESALEAVYEERLRLSPGAETLLQAARESGWKTLLVSGGFTFFTHRLQARLGLDHAVANTLETHGGRLTGRVLGDIVDAERKATELRALAARLGVAASRAIAIGDGANDLKMMGAAGMGIAYRAKPVVRQQATHALNFSGLDGVLNLFAQD
jgi:phosphoserine phosphatase